MDEQQTGDISRADFEQLLLDGPDGDWICPTADGGIHVVDRDDWLRVSAAVKRLVDAGAEPRRVVGWVFDIADEHHSYAASSVLLIVQPDSEDRHRILDEECTTAVCP